MRVDTLNLERPGLQAQLAAMNADVWVLTETNDEAVDLPAAPISAEHPARGRPPFSR
jgi:hypothetical protein